MRQNPSGSRQSVTLIECIVQVFGCQGAESGFVVLESALRKGRLEIIERLILLDLLAAEVADTRAAIACNA